MVTKPNRSEDEDEVQGYLNLLFSTPACSWCKDHNRRLYGKRLPLCGSCYGIRKSIRRLEKYEARVPPQMPSRSFDLIRYELDVARKMKALAEQDGNEFGDIDSRPMDALDLEHILVQVGKIAVGRELFDNCATLLDHSFGGSQQRLLFYMASEIVRAHRCKRRKHTAGYSLVGG
ncbi:MAG TPA: hypothetical protein VNM47_14380 [Terriglobia bacterium]|nr:hypothetical protein [Terriglobia bacterium]